MPGHQVPKQSSGKSVGVLANADFHAGGGQLSLPQQIARDFLRVVSLAAVGAHLGRHILENERGVVISCIFASASANFRCSTRPSISWAVLRVGGPILASSRSRDNDGHFLLASTRCLCRSLNSRSALRLRFHVRATSSQKPNSATASSVVGDSMLREDLVRFP